MSEQPPSDQRCAHCNLPKSDWAYKSCSVPIGHEYKIQATLPLPCPFCGSINVSVGGGETYRWRVAYCNSCGARAPDVTIQTSGAGSRDEWEVRAAESAMKEWNKRAAT